LNKSLGENRLELFQKKEGRKTRKTLAHKRPKEGGTALARLGGISLDKKKACTRLFKNLKPISCSRRKEGTLYNRTKKVNGSAGEHLSTSPKRRKKEQEQSGKVRP